MRALSGPTSTLCNIMNISAFENLKPLYVDKCLFSELKSLLYRPKCSYYMLVCMAMCELSSIYRAQVFLTISMILL